MDEHDALSRRFEENRTHLHAVAYRMLGSSSEADDAVQEAWLRLSRADATEVENLGGWLTTVVARVCLDMLRSRRSRREESLEAKPADVVEAPSDAGDPERETLVADAIGPALLLVLDTLAPAERLAFVLHDMFGVAFEEIAPIVGRTPTAARKLASRARSRVQGVAVEEEGVASATVRPERDDARRREVIVAFLTAARAGDFTALLALLDPEIVVRADAAAARLGAEREQRGAEAVAQKFIHRSRGARIALVDGSAGAAWAPGGAVRVVFDFTIVDGKLREVELVGDPTYLALVDLTFLEADPSTPTA